MNREERKVFYKNGKRQKEYVFFNHKTNPHNLIYKYSDEGELIQLDQINRKTGQTNWTEKYAYGKDSVTRTRDYFITFWGKIPPSEIETIYLNSDHQAVKTIIRNSKDGEDGIIISNYHKGLLLSQEWQNLEGTVIRKLEHQYE